MRVLVMYEGSSYGNSTNAPVYDVSLRRHSDAGQLTVTFEYGSPATGRGVGHYSGLVQSVSLTLPLDTAEALAHALQLARLSTVGDEIEFKVQEAGHSLRD